MYWLYFTPLVLIHLLFLRTAHDVQISDRYDISSFDIVNFENDEGTISVYIEEIAPGGSSSFNISVVPKLFGIYESTRARMRYVSGEVDSESEDDLESAIRNGYSSTVGRVKIISAEEYSQNQSMEATRTAFTAALVIVPVLFALFYFNRPEPTVAKKEKAAKKKR
jgi:hypothetical protein